MYKIYPTLCSEVLLLTAEKVLKACSASVLFFFYSGYCSALVINVYDVSQAPSQPDAQSSINSILRAPLIQQIDIRELNQRGTWGQGDSIGSYELQTTRTGLPQGQSIQRPQDPSKFHSKILKNPSQQKPPEQQKKKTKKKGKKKDKEEPFCTSAENNPLPSLLGTRRSGKYYRTFEEGSANAPDYSVTDHKRQNTFHPKKPEPGYLPNDFIGEIERLEHRYGRHGWHTYSDLQEDLSGYTRLWSEHLIDVVLGLDCRFKIAAIIATNQTHPHLAMILGYELILEPTDTQPHGLHLFLQVEVDPAIPTQIVLTHDLTENAMVAGSIADQQLFFSQQTPHPTTHIGLGVIETDDDGEYVEMMPTDGATVLPQGYDYVTRDMAKRLIQLKTGGKSKMVVPRNCRSHTDLNGDKRFHPDDFGFGGGGSGGASFYSASKSFWYQ